MESPWIIFQRQPSKGMEEEDEHYVKDVVVEYFWIPAFYPRSSVRERLESRTVDEKGSTLSKHVCPRYRIVNF